jgi:hypothetical protein
MRAHLGRAALSAAAAVVTAVAAGVLVPAVAASRPAAPRASLHVDFGPKGSKPAHGYLLDDGAAFSTARGYGWERVGTGKPLSLVGNGVRRGSPKDARYRTVLQLQAPHGPVRSAGQWQAVMRDGLYDVTVAVGDAATTDAFDVVTAQPHTAHQVRLVGGWKPSKAHHFLTVTKRVRVTNGRLTLSPAGGRDTTIDFVVATPVHTSAVPKPQPEPRPKPNPTTTGGPTTAPTTIAPTTAPTTAPGTVIDDDFTAGGTVGSGCQVTGFTGVLPDTAGDQCVPGNLAFVSGGLRLTSTAGQLANDNQQDALYTTFDAAGGSFTVDAQLLGPVDQLTQDYQQVGLFFGPDAKNFLKVEAEHNGSDSPHLTMFWREPGTPDVNGKTITTISLPALTTASTLDLVIRARSQALSVYYSLNGGALVQVGPPMTVQAADAASWFASAAKTGILTSNSNALTPITATFRRLTVSVP